ncbi:crystallin, beta B1, like 2 [Electrophorus electricus]|uniref:crystallin, beta B1, like 2 n=1 Tax=Electrophorus electricus TaxID=8005 RepID=UPI0015D084E7|nr:crystallin, beta B1, like 2 [Electrophorus electricus]
MSSGEEKPQPASQLDGKAAKTTEFIVLNICGRLYILEKSECWSNCHRNEVLLSFRPPQDSEKHKVCLYEAGDVKGRKTEIIDDDVPSLYAYAFTDRVGSIVVSCGTWVGSHCPGYHGSRYLLEQDDYRHFNEYGAHLPQMQNVRHICDMQWRPHSCYTTASK